jgi:hypothetical protein
MVSREGWRLLKTHLSGAMRSRRPSVQQEACDRFGNLAHMGLQGEVAGVDQTNVCVGQVATIGFSACGKEEGIVPAPDRQERRPVLTEIGLKGRI